MLLKYLDKLLENPHEFGARIVKFSDRSSIGTVNEHHLSLVGGGENAPFTRVFIIGQM